MEIEEWNYHKGSDDIDATMEDCFPWEELSKMAIDCSNKCLPVVVQYLWKEKANQPRCHKGTDHMCMMKIIQNSIEKMKCPEPKKLIHFNSKSHIVKQNRIANEENSTSLEISIRYKNDKKIIQEEILVYDTPGMVSQLGGVISLFLGVSMFSILCDILEFVDNKV